MSTEVFSVRIRKELKEIVKKYNDVDWRKLVEELIEEVAARKELEDCLSFSFYIFREWNCHCVRGKYFYYFNTSITVWRL